MQRTLTGPTGAAIINPAAMPRSGRENSSSIVLPSSPGTGRLFYVLEEHARGILSLADHARFGSDSASSFPRVFRAATRFAATGFPATFGPATVSRQLRRLPWRRREGRRTGSGAGNESASCRADRGATARVSQSWLSGRRNAVIRRIDHGPEGFPRLLPAKP